MIRLITMLFALISAPLLFAQDEYVPSTFHRLLIFNESNQLLVVKIKDRDLWVTPGWYQDNNSTIKEGLTKLADSYSLKITSPTLRGVFTLRMGSEQNTSTRLIHSTTTTDEEYIVPEGIDQVRWLQIDDALGVINIPHIRYQLRQIAEQPMTVWGGSQKMYRQNGTNHFEVIEDFYPLSVTTNQSD